MMSASQTNNTKVACKTIMKSMEFNLIFIYVQYRKTRFFIWHLFIHFHNSHHRLKKKPPHSHVFQQKNSSYLNITKNASNKMNKMMIF